MDQEPQRYGPRVPLARSAQYLLALLSGALLVLCFPGPDQGWLAWVALVPLFMALHDGPSPGEAMRRRRGAGLGFVTGVVFLGGLLHWIWIFGWYAWLALALFQALWIALFGALVAALLRRVPLHLGPPALAAAWTAVEWLRSLGGLGLTWGDLAVSQHRALPVLQMLDWTGPWGLSFLIALVNASAAGLLLAGVQAFRRSGVQAFRRSGRVPAKRVRAFTFSAPGKWLVGTVLVVALLTARGYWILSRPGGGATLAVAVVQGNIDQDVPWDADYAQRAMGTHARLTLAAVSAGARLVVWSETSLPGELRHDPSLRAAVTGLARAAGAELIVGSNDHEGDCEYNRAFLVDRQGWIRGAYAKRHLVPYGECVPMHAWLPFMDALHVRPFNLTPGEAFLPLRGEHRLGVVVCFESGFPGIARAMARSGAELLVEITNDTWFGRTSAAEQHAAMAPLRAIETRRAFARATATGISTLVDDRGRVRRRLGLFREGYLLEPLRLRRDLTPYTRLGDWPVLLSALFCLIGLRPGVQAFGRSGVQNPAKAGPSLSAPERLNT